MTETDERYEVTFVTGPPGFADMTSYRFATLKEARACRRNSLENHEPYFRWSKITDLVTGQQLME